MKIKNDFLDKKVYKITAKKKNIISIKINKNKSKIFNEEYIKTVLPTIKDLNEIDLTKLLNMNTDEYNKCLFFEKHFCWISSNDKGKQRYFTKKYITYSMDIYELFSIYFNCSYNRLFTYLSELGFNNSEYRDSELEKSNFNKEYMNKLISSNKYLASLIGDKLDIFFALIDFGAKNSLFFSNYKAEPIFFISVRYLKEKYNLKYSISTINQMINYYCLLGILKKMPEEEIANPIYKAYKELRFKKASISFYSVYSLKDKEKEVLNKSEILFNENIKYYNLTKKKAEIICKKFNELSMIYNLNLGGGDKTQKAEKIKEKKDDMEILFNYYLLREQMVAKEWLKDKNNKNISNSAFNKKWNELVSSKTGIVIKPTKRHKVLYNLKSNQDIFIFKG